MKLNKHIFILFILLFICNVKPQGIKDTTSASFPLRIYPNVVCNISVRNIICDCKTLLASNVKPQVVKDTASSDFPYSIYSIDSRLVDEYYSFDYRTHYTHDVIPFIESGYNFEIELKLKLEGNYTVPDSSIGVIMKTWKGEEEKYILNPKNAVLKYNNYYNFIFAFVSDNRSFATCSLVLYDKTNNTFGPAVYSNIKMSRSVLLH